MSEDFDDTEGCGTDESLALADESRGGRTARAAVASDNETDSSAYDATDTTVMTDAADADGATADESAALLDAVRIEIRRGEIVITIRADALEAAAATPSRIETRWAGRGGAPAVAAPVATGRTAAVARAAAARTGAAPTFVGLANVPADKYGDGYNYFRIRGDLTDSYRAAYRQVKALGGVLTSSGGIRDLGERATAGRSRTSLHYTGRAIDLFIYTGMQGGTEPYLVTRNGGTDDNPEWKLYCVSTTPLVDDPLYDASLIKEGELECVRWQRGTGYKTYRRRARYFSLTDVFARHGWVRIPARSDWRTQYLSCEWWHFQNDKGLAVGDSTFGDQLREVWPADKVRASGLALEATWAGRSFRVGQPVSRPAAPPPPALDPAEKIYWAQVVLNATAGEALATDGKPGTHTTAALQRFQSRNGLQPSGVMDASTEVALLQGALRRIAGQSFPRIGVLDDGTVAAVIQFQRAGGLNPDGRAGAKTRAAMVAALGSTPFAAATPAVAAPATLQPVGVSGRPTRGRAADGGRVSRRPASPRAARAPARAASHADGAGGARPQRPQRRGRAAGPTAEGAETRG
jgi:peptidoglycan hydrolase-like protein with peptidoglycan-binding domain